MQKVCQVGCVPSPQSLKIRLCSYFCTKDRWSCVNEVAERQTRGKENRSGLYRWTLSSIPWKLLPWLEAIVVQHCLGISNLGIQLGCSLQDITCFDTKSGLAIPEQVVWVEMTILFSPQELRGQICSFALQHPWLHRKIWEVNRKPGTLKPSKGLLGWHVLMEFSPVQPSGVDKWKRWTL